MAASERCGAPTATGRPCRRAAGASGTCSAHPSAATITAHVDRALAGHAPDWRTALARTLAAALDADPNASMARELRAVMAALDADTPTPADVGDELRERRDRRLADAAGQ